MDTHEDFWRGDFGNEYLDRNRIDYTTRLPFWTATLNTIAVGKAIEVGCNKGTNLQAIRHIDPDVIVMGLDVNEQALIEASDAGITAVNLPARYVGEYFPRAADLTFTAGVLIHVPPSDLEAVMRSIIASSRRYVMCIEYEDVDEVEVVYRGHTDRLWRRPYGKLYQDLGLKLIERGPAEGFDSCTWWLFTKEAEA